MSRELSQVQELIHRAYKDVGDKTISLKSTGEELVSLRKDIKLMKEEN